MSSPEWTMSEQDRLLAEAIGRDEPRLRGFIRRRVADTEEAEDILQDVFYELIETYRLTKPIEQVTAWLFRVARNRVIDFFRKKRPDVSLHEAADDELSLEEMLPSPEDGPDAKFARSLLLDLLEGALEELPANQREVFVAHEIEGESFKEISARTGVSVNTLLSRKRYAVLHLRERLQDAYEGFEKN